MKKAYEIFRSELDSIKEAGTYKDERIITTPQKARIDTTCLLYTSPSPRD